MAKMLIVSPEFNCSNEVLTIVAMLSGQFFTVCRSMRHCVLIDHTLLVPNVWLRPPNQRKEADQAKALMTIADGDHLTLMNVYNSYQNSTSARFCRRYRSSSPL